MQRVSLNHRPSSCVHKSRREVPEVTYEPSSRQKKNAFPSRPTRTIADILHPHHRLAMKSSDKKEPVETLGVAADLICKRYDRGFLISLDLK